MKNVYLALAVLFFAFTGCKDKETTDTENSMDSTAVQTDNMNTETDTMAVDTTAMPMDSTESASDAKSNVKLPNKISETEKTIPGEKGKFSLAETKWGLIELNGKEIEPTTRRDYFINFDSKSGTFRAFVGCNKMNGKYFMKSEGKVGFTDVVSTRKACDNMDTERNFYNGLQKVDSYMIEDGGKVLHLHAGKKAVAKFQAIR